MDPEALKAELEQDPSGIGYADPLENGSDQALADLLNAPRDGIYIPFPAARKAVKAYLIGAGKLLAIAAPAADAPGVAHAAAYILADPDYAEIDFNDSRAQAVLGGLKTAGLLDDTDLAALAALGQRAGSRAEQLFGAGAAVTASDVSFALRGQR